MGWVATLDYKCYRGGFGDCAYHYVLFFGQEIANRSQLCVSISATRPLLAIYLPQLLESQRPLTRALKEVYDSNELSDASPHPANLHIPEKEIPGYSSNVHQPTARDLERGVNTGHDDEDKVTLGIH